MRARRLVSGLFRAASVRGPPGRPVRAVASLPEAIYFDDVPDFSTLQDDCV